MPIRVGSAEHAPDAMRHPPSWPCAAAKINESRQDLLIESSMDDGGRPSEVEFSGTGFKPPQAAVIKSDGCER